MPARRPAGTAEGWLALSLEQYQAHRYEDCIRSSEHALELRPAYAEAYNNICAALKRARQLRVGGRRLRARARA